MTLALRKAGLRDLFVARAVVIEEWRERVERDGFASAPPDISELARRVRDESVWLIENKYGTVAVVFGDVAAAHAPTEATADTTVKATTDVPLSVVMRPIWDEPGLTAETVELAQQVGCVRFIESAVRRPSA